MKKKTEIIQAHIDQAHEMAVEGCSRSAIAKALAISVETLISYNGVLHQTIKSGRAIYQEETAHKIEQALVNKAIGYNYDESKIVTKPDGEETTVMYKHMTASVQAAEFYLINYSRKYKKDDWQSVNTVTLAEDSEKVDLLNKLAQHLQANIEEPKKVKKSAKK